MSKPDDIPQDVWITAQAVESDCINATWNGSAKGSRTISETIIARAIMAAKAGEREECALVAEDHENEDGTGPDCDGCGEVIAERIRKRGEA